MKAGIYVTLPRDEIRTQTHYDLIAETMSSHRWQTLKRRNLMAERFTEAEREAIIRMGKQAHQWHLKTGVPEELKMTLHTLYLWRRLANFCFEL